MLKRISTLALFLIITIAVFAQAPERNVSVSKKMATPDSLLNKKLNSFYFNDSLNRIRLFAWNVSSYTNIPTRIKLDTGQRNVQRVYPFYEMDNVGAVYLGNIGSATVNLDFFKNVAKTPFFFQNVYTPFLSTPDDVKFYNTKVPYSRVRYVTAGNRTNAEEIFGLTIAQNVSPSLSFGINYDRWGTKGMYKRQRSKTKDFSAYASYLGKKYTAYAGYIYNLADVQENGGVADEKEIRDTVIKPEYINIKLRNASNIVRNNTFFLSQTYGVQLSNSENFTKNGIYSGPLLLVGMYSKYATYHRIYKDDMSEVDQIKYYNNFYIDPKISYDSTRLREIDNRFYAQIRPYTDNSLLNLFGGGIGYQNLKYYMFNFRDYLYGNKSTTNYNAYVYGYASGKFRKYIDWNAFGKLVLAGYNSGDIDTKGTASFSIYPWEKEVKLVGEFKFKTETPDFYISNFFSNHFKWNNNFERVVDTRVELKLDIPFLDLEIGARQAVVDGYIYFAKDTLPKQAGSVISVTSAYLKKNLAIGHLHLDGQVLFQKSSKKDILPLPAIAANVAVYYQFNIVKNVLKSQLGVDVKYNSAYYTYAYNPAVGQFHLQNVRKVGNYPWMDAFANFKWKRAALFFKVTNIGKDYVGDYDYFSALGYPRVPIQLQYGLTWSFYD